MSLAAEEGGQNRRPGTTKSSALLVPEAGSLAGGDLDGDGGEVHHLQHLLGLSVNLNNVLKQNEM